VLEVFHHFARLAADPADLLELGVAADLDALGLTD